MIDRYEKLRDSLEVVEVCIAMLSRNSRSLVSEGSFQDFAERVYIKITKHEVTENSKEVWVAECY